MSRRLRKPPEGKGHGLASWRLTLFQQVLLSYLAILVFPLLAGAFIYTRTIGMIERDVEATNLAILDHSREMVDESLTEIDWLISKLVFDEKVLTFLSMEPLREGSPEIAKVKEAWERLNSFTLTSPFVRDIMILAQRSSLVISQKISYARESLFYGALFTLAGVDLAQWQSAFIGKTHVKELIPCSEVALLDERFPAVAYLQSVPLDFARANQGLVLALIDNGMIRERLGKLRLERSGLACVADRDGRVIASLPSVPESLLSVTAAPGAAEGVLKARVGGEKMLVSYCTSPLTGWRYVAAVSLSDVMAKVISVRRILMAFLFLTAAVGLLLTVIFAYRNVRPITDLVDLLRPLHARAASTRSDYYDFLRRSVSALISTNRRMKATLEKQLPLVRATSLRRLLEGTFRSPEESAATMSHLGIKMEGRVFVVVLLRISAAGSLLNAEILRELDASRVVAKEVMEKHFARGIQLVDMDERHTALLVGFEEQDRGRCVETLGGYLAAAVEELSQSYNLPVVAGVGGFYEHLSDIHFSYAEASRALEHMRFGPPRSICWHRDLPKQTDGVYYPFEAEARLVNLMKLGRADDVRALLDRIFEENFHRRRLSGEEARRLLDRLCETQARFVEQYGQPAGGELQHTDAPEGSSIEETIAGLQERFARCCAQAMSWKDLDESHLKDRVLDFVHSSYMRYDLCLYTLASQFKYSESYLYHFFVQRVGMSFSSYLEKVRMRHACDLLGQAEVTIDAVASQSGYGSAHSFRRAFKRVMGVLPSEYRDLLLNPTAVAR